MFRVCFVLCGICFSTLILPLGQSSQQEPATRKSHEGLHGTLWIQTALEHDVACIQAYSLATDRVSQALNDTSWTAATEQTEGFAQLPPAVVLDVDETVLDNSAFQARLVADDTEFSSDRWARWVDEEKADAMPGVRDFLEFALSRNVAIFFVTNRSIEGEEATTNNLRAVLGMHITPEQVLCKNERSDWGSDKTTRRTFLAQRHRILLLIGDDFNDFVFLGDVAPEARLNAGTQFKARWGKEWILLPNALYGHWERALYRYEYGLPEAEKLRLKYDRLDTRRDAKSDG